MIRVMFDSDVPADLPEGMAPLYATYADLITSRSALVELSARLAGSQLVFLDRGLGDPLGLATIADVEPRALKPADLPGWFARKAAAGREFLTVYSDRADLTAIDEALKGTPHEDHWRWIATDDGTVDISGLPPLHRPAVVQAVGAGQLGIHADLSLVLNPGWHPAPPR